MHSAAGRRVAALALLAACGPAAAHGSSKSLGTFFGGVVHPLVEPAHLVALIALALLLGRRGATAEKQALFAFAAGLGLGLVAAGLGWQPPTEPLLLASAAASGLCIAAASRLPLAVHAVAAAVVGAGIGFGSAPEATASAALWGALLGTFCGGMVWLINGVELVNRLRRPWMAVLVRIAGSWLVASSLLVLALWFSGRQPAATAGPAGAASAALTDLRR